MSIGENLKRLREKQSLTQNDLAIKVGVTQPLIAQFERGSKIPNMLLGKDIAAALNCHIDDIMEN